MILNKHTCLPRLYPNRMTIFKVKSVPLLIKSLLSLIVFLAWFHLETKVLSFIRYFCNVHENTIGAITHEQSSILKNLSSRTQILAQEVVNLSG